MECPESWKDDVECTAWLPRSPDFTTLHIYLWGYIKTYVYSANTQHIEI